MEPAAHATTTAMLIDRRACFTARILALDPRRSGPTARLGPFERTLVECPVVRYRVEQLASVCDVSVDTVRYYLSRGLLLQPDRQAGLAWYAAEHADRIRQ